MDWGAAPPRLRPTLVVLICSTIGVSCNLGNIDKQACRVVGSCRPSLNARIRMMRTRTRGELLNYKLKCGSQLIQHDGLASS